MDPDSNLFEQADLARCIVEAWDGVNGLVTLTEAYRASTGRDLEDDALELAQLVQALDGWMRGGGALPAPWRAVAVWPGTPRVPAVAITIGRELARDAFASRGNRTEAHLSELQLAALLTLAAVRMVEVEEAARMAAREAVADAAAAWQPGTYPRRYPTDEGGR